MSNETHAQRIIANALSLLRSVLQSHRSLRLSDAFIIKITVLDIRHIEYKRQRGTLRTPEDLSEESDFNIS